MPAPFQINSTLLTLLDKCRQKLFLNLCTKASCRTIYHLCDSRIYLNGWILSSLQPCSFFMYSYLLRLPPQTSYYFSINPQPSPPPSLSLSLSLVKLKLFSVKHKRPSLIKVHPTFIKNLFFYSAAKD